MPKREKEAAKSSGRADLSAIIDAFSDTDSGASAESMSEGEGF